MLSDRGLRIVSGRTDCHLFLVDLRPKKITGKERRRRSAGPHITVNKNAIPNDPEKPMVTSGIRIGSPAMTTRGFGSSRGGVLARLIADVLDKPTDDANNPSRGRAMCRRSATAFPVYG